ncbi:beta-lactamase family protein [Hymenobacter sp. BT186]|uniref:Beta-lactamase family protein n=1 Tax=Hymenobacter telluris TaxID=2816474 RepID=A0A939JAK3_9BACT|nr:serine hydrolase domain-containing protein [Hymenobacter telluris]MBO0358196.1 beta-lactamase family protein [Hymenobacter telluris]MBW3374222.1 beta-lactamase family protein [Hymenobacter norwichensis]
MQSLHILLMVILKKLLLLLPLLVGLAVPTVHAQRQPVTTVAQLTDSIQRIMAKEHMPGVLLTLVAHDSVLFEGGLGLADVENKQPVTAHTLFRVGSVTKMFVAVGLLQLVEQGKLHLNDEVRKLAPEITIDNPWEATDPVRVVHLLEHTAGFDDMHLNHVYNSTPTDPRGTAAVQVFRRELRCRWRPGERMSYSNPGYLLAGYLLEKLSRQPYEQYLAQHLLRPLGMPDATADLRPATNPKLARGYAYDAGHYRRLTLLPIYAGPAGSMSASAADLTRWVQFFLHDFRAPDGTQLLQPASLREMETVHSPLEARAGLLSGYGLANQTMNWKGKASFRGHGGGIDGFRSTVAYNRELGVGYALSNNGDQGTSSIDKVVREFLLRQAPTPAPAPVVALDVAAVTPYLGHYENAAPRNQLFGLGDYLLGDQHLTQNGQFLLLQPLVGSPDTLLPTGPLTFRRPGQRQATVVLTQDRDNHRTLVTADSYLLEASSAWWWLRPALFGLSLLLIVTASVAGLIWLIFALRRQTPRTQVLPRLLPLLAAVVLVVTVVAFVALASQVWDSGHFNFKTVLLGVGPVLFGLLILAGLALTVRHFRQFRSRVVAWYLLLTYGALGWLAFALASYGWMSLQLWAV